MKDYVKHLIQCKCILMQFRKMPDPPLHKFIVFSEIEPPGIIVNSLAQCPNCGVVHKVKEVGVSEVLRKEDAPSVLTIDEIKSSLPEKLVAGFTGYELELHQWMEIKWIIDNEQWGRNVVLTRDSADGLVTGKYVQIISKDIWRFSNFSREEVIAEKNP